MSRRAEEKFSFVGAEWRVVGVYGNGIRCGALLREANLELNVEELLVVCLTLGEKCLEAGLVLGRHGEVNLRTVSVASI